MAEAEVSGEDKKVEVTDSPCKKSSQGGLDVDAFHNFLQGKRHLLVKDYSHAVGSLAKACELYVKHYGETAVECAEVYYHYGIALFRYFQKQAGILGDVLPDGSEEDEEENASGSEEEEEEKDKENTDSNSNSNENEENEEVEEEDLEDEDEDAKKEEEAADESKGKPEVEQKVKSSSAKEEESASSSSEVKTVSDAACDETSLVQQTVHIDTTSAKPSDSQESQPSSSSCDAGEAGPSTSQAKQKSEDDISDLQLAWETLETAKTIFRRQGSENRDARLKVAEILLILGEISMELENYVSAVEDLKECLYIRQQLLKPDDRLIAETYYQIALAYTYDSQVKPALENYEKSMQVIQMRIESLKNQKEVEKTPEGFDIDPQVEIDELEGILPDIKAKMEDTQDMMQDAKKVVKELNFPKPSESPAPGSSSDKPATNISHLLKRKKPEDADGKANEVKKIKLVSTENGENQSSEVVNPETASPPKA